jgi:Ferredoxin-thioredoxin reductase, catalytic subunit
MENKIKARVEKLRKDAGSYKLNPDEGFVEMLAEGLLRNKERYGIETCPCRLYEGDREDNVDIVCPCVYRDDDIAEYGACFCALYVGDKELTKQTPERRPPLAKRREDRALGPAPSAGLGAPLPYPVYRCTVCGYLMAGNHPPAVCPICKAGKERFERFM